MLKMRDWSRSKSTYILYSYLDIDWISILSIVSISLIRSICRYTCITKSIWDNNWSKWYAFTLFKLLYSINIINNLDNAQMNMDKDAINQCNQLLVSDTMTLLSIYKYNQSIHSVQDLPLHEVALLFAYIIPG